MSKLTRTLAVLNKKLNWKENNSVGYAPPASQRNKYLNPLLSPPPRSPRTSEDFMHPEKLGHWYSTGMDYTNPVADKYMWNELGFSMITCTILGLWWWAYSPDLKLFSWARREAYLRTHKREALGLPLIERDIVDPDRIVLPTEEELEDFPVTM